MSRQNNTMPQEDSVRKKMLPFYIIEVLEEDTDEENALLPSEIKAKINSRYGENVVNKVDTIIENIDAINEFFSEKLDGVNIIQSKLLEKAKKYRNNPRFYLAIRRLEFSEIIYLTDLILNSKTLEQKHAQYTCKKLLGFLSKHQRQTIKGTIFSDGSAKTPNKAVYLNLEKIQQAIAAKQNIEFKYCEYNLNKQLVPRIREYKYIVSPYGATCSNGSYYLIGYHLPTKRTRTYRIDKIKDAVINNDTEYYIDSNADLKLYVKNAVFMHADENKISVKLRCGMDILDDVIERFENCRLFPDETSRQHFIAEIPDTTRQGMLYWTLQFSSSCELLEPAELREKVRDTLARALGWYEKQISSQRRER